MNPITIFLLSLESKVAKAEPSTKKTPEPKKGKAPDSYVLQSYNYGPERLNPVKLEEGEKGPREEGTQTEYEKLRKELKPLEQRAPARPATGKLFRAAVNNVKNVAVNAFDNTVGYIIAQAQNYRTKRHYKQNPDSKEVEVVLIPGLFQNKGSQWRLASDLRKAGYQPYHLKNHNGKPKHQRERLAFQQLDDLVRDTGAKNHDRVVSGHSDGAALAIGMATYQDAPSKYRIRAVQARAPSVHGLPQARTIGQRIMIPLAPNDNVRKSLYARQGAVEHGKKKPYVPVHVVAGEYDGLVTPNTAVYKHAASHQMVRGQNSTHFGTSGANGEMNSKFVRHIDDLVRDYSRKPEPHKRMYKAA